MRARLLFIVLAGVVVAGLAALNWGEVTRTSRLNFGLILTDAPLAGTGAETCSAAASASALARLARYSAAPKSGTTRRMRSSIGGWVSNSPASRSFTLWPKNMCDRSSE